MTNKTKKEDFSPEIYKESKEEEEDAIIPILVSENDSVNYNPENNDLKQDKSNSHLHDSSSLSREDLAMGNDKKSKSSLNSKNNNNVSKSKTKDIQSSSNHIFNNSLVPQQDKKDSSNQENNINHNFLINLETEKIEKNDDKLDSGIINIHVDDSENHLLNRRSLIEMEETNNPVTHENNIEKDKKSIINNELLEDERSNLKIHILKNLENIRKTSKMNYQLINSDEGSNLLMNSEHSSKLRSIYNNNYKSNIFKDLHDYLDKAEKKKK